MDRDDETWPAKCAALLALAKHLTDVLTDLRGRLQLSELENAKLKQVVARLKRMQFGRSSERHAGQFAFELETPGAGEAKPGSRPLRPLPTTMAARSIRYAGRCRTICRAPSCGASLTEPAEDATVRAVAAGCMSSARTRRKFSITSPATSG